MPKRHHVCLRQGDVGGCLIPSYPRRYTKSLMLEYEVTLTFDHLQLPLITHYIRRT